MLGITLALGAIIAVWAMYKAIVYAVPCLIGWGLARVAIDTGAGWFGAVLLGLATAVGSYFLLRFLLAQVRSRPLRWAIGALLALPTAIVGYSVGIDALASNVPAQFWRQTLAAVFALTLGAISFVRMTEFDPRDE